MTITQVLDQIKKKIFHPIYFLEGEEVFFIDEITNLLEESVLAEVEKPFNQTLFYGRDTDANQLINACRRYPMGSDYQLILLKEAQSMAKLENILPYIENPLKSTVLVINYKYGKLDKRTHLAKTLFKNAFCFESKKLYDDKIPDWIMEYVLGKEFKITPKASSLLADYLGNDLGKITGELEKLFLSLGKGFTIDIPLIESNIGISREYNVFELGTAIAKREIEKIYKIIFYFGSNPKDHPIVVIIGFLGTFFSKVLSLHFLKGLDRASQASKLGVNPYFLSNYEIATRNYPVESLPKIISGIRKADSQSKGIDMAPNTADADILKELIYNILHD